MSKVQFNLLPDAKLTHVKTQRTKGLVVSIAFLASAVALALLAILFLSVQAVQKKMIGDADKNITRLTKELKAVPNIEKALTIQNQLNSLPDLHQKKHITSRIFSYLPQVTPANITISRLDINLAEGTMAIDGRADSQVAVNTFIDTLKFTTYKVGGTDSGKNAFPTVTQSAFTINPGNVTYGLTITFDPVLFANDQLDDSGKALTPELVVPKLTTTHASASSSAEQIFQEGGGQ